jgi:SAM-dependent methyltransferase
MDERHLEELIAVEGSYWWHVAKRELVIEQLMRRFPPPGQLVEGGVGAGGNLQAFRELGYEVRGFDVSPAAVVHCRKLGLENVEVHDLEADWPVPHETVRAVVLLDVLEHLAEPVRVLQHAARAIRADGGIIVSVPAGPVLMGPWDVMLGHRRRYTRKLLREQAAAAGLRVLWMSYWNSFTYPAAVLVRTFEKWRHRPRAAEFPPVRPVVNRLLIGCARIERWWLRRAPAPCGLSLLGVCAR